MIVSKLHLIILITRVLNLNLDTLSVGIIAFKNLITVEQSLSIKLFSRLRRLFSTLSINSKQSKYTSFNIRLRDKHKFFKKESDIYVRINCPQIHFRSLYKTSQIAKLSKNDIIIISLLVSIIFDYEIQQHSKCYLRMIRIGHTQLLFFKQNCKSSSHFSTMIQTHLHVGQSQPHTSEAPVLQFLGKSKKRKRRSLESNDWISLVDHKIKGNSHTQYLIRVKVDNVVWSFWTRYSMLLQLYKTMDQVLKSELPQFPSKRLFGNLDQDFIQHRKSQLNQCLQILFQNQEVRDTQVFKEFITNSKQKAFKKAEFESLHKFKLDV